MKKIMMNLSKEQQDTVVKAIKMLLNVAVDAITDNLLGR